MSQELLPLANVFREVLTFLGTREDAVICGAHAVNAYCEPERMTADIDVLSTDAASLSEAVRALLAERFRIAARVREVVPGGFRVYQVRKPKNRHLVDVRQTASLPPFRRIENVRVIEPADLVALKAIGRVARKGQEKGLSDTLDLYRLLRAFPELRAETGPVPARLRAHGGSDAAHAAWLEVADAPLDADADDAFPE
jgi:hypothetical protein